MTDNRSRNTTSQFINARSEIHIMDESESFEEALLEAANAYVTELNRRPGESWSVVIED